MNTIGSYLKNARLKKKISVKKLEDITKIKSSFIEYIENQQWDKLPEGAVVGGFVKNIASSLKIDVRQASALFRRDYPRQNLKINPSPDINQKFTWGPKSTFLLMSFFVVVAVFSYLLFQYISFNRPPKLEVIEPVNGQTVEKKVKVSGLTQENATLTVNGQPVVVEENGNFSVEIEIADNQNEIEVKSISVSGKESLVKREVIVKN